MTNVVDGSFFHVKIIDKNSSYGKIDQAMLHFEPTKVEELQKPIIKGTLCAVKHPKEKKWYRGKVVQNFAKGQIEVLFIDYGNTITLSTEGESSH